MSFKGRERTDSLPLEVVIKDMGKEKKTVKKKIFYSNTLMVLVTLLIFLAVNVAIAKVYVEIIEQDFREAITWIDDEDDLEEALHELTVYKNSFIFLFLLDGVICIGVLLFISQLFTRNLTNHILKPLNELADGANRVKNGNLTAPIAYQGESEFEDVCHTFNNMQAHILMEQEKNRKYEKARTDMVAGISHDLRTPLTAVRGTIKGLMDGIASSPEQQQLFLETAYRRTGDMDALLQRLFYFSKMETGNMPLHMEKANLTAFLNGYVRRKQEDPKKIEYLILADIGDEIWVVIDLEQMQRILDNLLENSFKYAGTEELRIRVELSKKEKNAHLVFSDNGQGVLEEKLPHIFEEFYRCDESRNRKEGNGLGLYIVKYLVETMGGEVCAENLDGLAVHIIFPLAQENENG